MELLLFLHRYFQGFYQDFKYTFGFPYILRVTEILCTIRVKLYKLFLAIRSEISIDDQDYCNTRGPKRVNMSPTRFNINEHDFAVSQHESTRDRHELTYDRHELTQINTNST